MGVKKYFKNELQLSMFSLEHDSAPDFYLSCWQNNRSCVPLLCIRFLLCGVNVGTIIASMVILAGLLNGFGFWWIYLTHWGIVANALATMFAFGISLRVYFRGPIDATFGLPWYIKIYWFLYNAAVLIAFTITIFYWTLIRGSDEFPEFNKTLDVFLHGVNSIVMVLLVLTARHPSHLLHFHHPLAFGILYLIFNMIYYYAGGLDPNGNAWVYPMMDWSKPGSTSVMVIMVAVGIVLLHCLVVLITLGRNYCSRRLFNHDRFFSISG